MSLFKDATISTSMKTFISQKMKSVEGYLSEDEAALFSIVGDHHAKSNITGDIAEFGVWRGRSALVLYQLLRENEKLFAVDLFDLRDQNHPFFNDPGVFLAHCQRLSATDRMHILKVDTTVDMAEISQAIHLRSCRIVHVDGGHTYRVAKRDIDFAFGAVSEDGIIVCDDILAKKFPGVTQAFVEASLANPEFVPIALTKKKVWSAHRKNSIAYKVAIAQATNRKWPTANFMGGKMLVLH